jgi:SpoVK/Ycf46/Vps4 family AAA+-type ATPase
MSLSTSDCKQMWIGWSADRLAKVFKEAREKQPSLMFIDELDAVCPHAELITTLSTRSSLHSSYRRSTGC